MDLDVLKDQWRQHAQEEMPVALEANAVMSIITAKATDIRRTVRQRLRREATYYLPMVAITVTLFFEGITPIRLGVAGGLLLLLGGIAATLWLAQHRIADTMFDRSVRDALMDLRSKIDAAARAYLVGYVVTFVCSAAVLAAMVWWRQGLGVAFVATVVIGSLAVWWSYRSGQAYVERLFQRDRTNVSECLGQLDAERSR
jgi:hypothetical protein